MVNELVEVVDLVIWRDLISIYISHCNNVPRRDSCEDGKQGTESRRRTLSLDK